jgi:hypothetical protein
VDAFHPGFHVCPHARPKACRRPKSNRVGVEIFVENLEMVIGTTRSAEPSTDSIARDGYTQNASLRMSIVTAMTYETQPPCASTSQSSLSSWRSQLSSITKPPCTQASAGGQLCSTIKDAYVHQQNSVFFPNVSFAPYFSNGYLGSFANITAGNYTKSWWWPTSSTLGVPGCTLECGR